MADMTNTTRSETQPGAPANGRAKRLVLYPIGLDEANAFVRAHHRHHRGVVGHKFSLSATLGLT